MTPPDDGATPRRTWMPLALALGIAALVVVGAFVANALRSGLPAAKADAVRACEAAYASQAESGTPLAAIVGGDVFAAGEWRDRWALLQGHGYLAEAPTDEEAAAAEARAEGLAAAGRDTIEVVWLLENGEHWTCAVEVEADAADDATVTLARLVPAGEAAD
ncbi:hypothetical protein [Demequina pelophila]|uniref:hypothetical protein n=1 Tax=Demequina pelophila TaxID=1638984 RepID=UPI0007854E3E|nr:hypothetical protein [Demequina pelophila]